jgi:hypothetical protein
MSYVQGSNSEDPRIHFRAGMKDLFRVDEVRLINIWGSIQYGLLYAIAFFFAGICIELMFPPFRANATFETLAYEVILQCIVTIIAIFYVRKLVESIPGLITFFPSIFNRTKLKNNGFIPYGIEEYKGEGMMSLILIGTEVNLIKKIGRLSILGTRRFLER